MFNGLSVFNVLSFLEKQERRAPDNYRDPSGQKPLNFHGVPFGDKSDVSLFMENPWIMHGLSMDYQWITHGLPMDNNPWKIHGYSMDNP